MISNHDDLAPKVEAHGIPFFHLPVTTESQAEQEARVEALLREHEIDLAVLARYMQYPLAPTCRILLPADHQHPSLISTSLRGS